jgi:hypothetical protein
VQNGARRFASTLLLALMGAGVALAAPHVVARKASAAPRAKPNSIDINYVAPKSAKYQRVYALLKERQALEKIRELLSPLRLPHRLLLETRDCDGVSNAMSNEDNVIVCYEYIDEILKNAPKATTPSGITPTDAVIGPFVDVFLHEAGHAVFSILVTMTQQAFADEHGTSAQRFYNLLCMAYGSDPKLFGDVVEKGFLPEDRASGCRREYLQVSQAFESLIGLHIDKDLARKLHKRWLPPVTTQLKP